MAIALLGLIPACVGGTPTPDGEPVLPSHPDAADAAAPCAAPCGRDAGSMRDAGPAPPVNADAGAPRADAAGPAPPPADARPASADLRAPAAADVAAAPPAAAPPAAAPPAAAPPAAAPAGSGCQAPVGLRPVAAPDATVGDGTPGSCTEEALRRAIERGGAIAFRCGPAPKTIALAAELVLTKSAVIDGGGTITLSGGGRTRHLRIVGETDVALQRLAFVDGRPAVMATDDGAGGAVRREYGNGGKARLAVVGCTFKNNQAAAGLVGGGINAGGGAIASHESALTIVDSRFEGNAGGSGGAVNSLLGPLGVYDSTFVKNRALAGREGGGGGGGLHSDTTGRPDLVVTICGSSFLENTTPFQGGGAMLYGGRPPTVNYRIDRSTFARNEATSAKGDEGFGGGLYFGEGGLAIAASAFEGNVASAQGGGLYVASGAPRVEITNTTLAGNRAESADGKSGLGGGIMRVAGSFLLTNVTLTANVAGFQGGGLVGGKDVTLRNTILARNLAKNGGNDWNIKHNCAGANSDGGGNLQFPAKHPTDRNDEDCAPGIRVADPQLGPAGAHGGPTATAPLAAGSPAIGQGVAAACPPTDQRGSPRKPRCDVGAFERAP